MAAIQLVVNGAQRKVEAETGVSLLSVLRDQLGLTGTKYGCGEGQCGACAVLVEGKAVKSCVTTAAEVAGRPVVTIEGLAAGEQLHPVQQAFLDHAAFQCGYCTPGMIVGAVSLLRERPQPTAADVRRSLNGHICRCGTYPRIVTAVLAAARFPGAKHD